MKSGFYAHVRNPMYIGNYLILSGFVLIYSFIWAYVAVLPFFTLVHYAIVKNEESYLRQTFGQEYAEYEASVNRFIPNFKHIGRSLEHYRYDWKKVLNKEYGTIAFVLCGLLLMMIWENITLFGYAQKAFYIKLLLLGLIPVVLFYGIIRYLKKTGRLVSAQLSYESC